MQDHSVWWFSSHWWETFILPHYKGQKQKLPACSRSGLLPAQECLQLGVPRPHWLKLEDGSASTHGPSCPRTLHHGTVMAPDFPSFRISDVRQEQEGEVLLILLQDRSVPAELGTALRQVGEKIPSKIISSTSMPAKPPPARALGTGTEEWTSLFWGGSVWLFDERHPGVTQM